MLQSFEQHGPHGVFGSIIAQGFQGLQANRGILILARGGQQRIAYVGISSARLQGFQAIQAQAGINRSPPFTT